MDTIYKKVKCGATIAGYGKDDLNKHIKSHEERCDICKGIPMPVVEPVKEEKIVEEKNELDLNDDKEVEKKNASIAGKVLNSIKKASKSKRKGNKK